jgi:hypothetical protein
MVPSRSSSSREFQQEGPALPGEELVPWSQGHSRNKALTLWLAQLVHWKTPGPIGTCLLDMLAVRWLWDPWTRLSKSCDIHSLHLPSRRWTIGQGLKPLRPSSGRCTLLCFLPGGTEDPKLRPSKSYNFHSLPHPLPASHPPHAYYWTAGQGLRRLRPASENRIVACVYCHVTLRTLSQSRPSEPCTPFSPNREANCWAESESIKAHFQKLHSARWV